MAKKSADTTIKELKPRHLICLLPEIIGTPPFRITTRNSPDNAIQNSPRTLLSLQNAYSPLNSICLPFDLSKQDKIHVSLGEKSRSHSCPGEYPDCHVWRNTGGEINFLNSDFWIHRRDLA
ncbi:hypothetical protein AAMO2058_000373900 [Amorphochlora amoebiformis]